MDLLLATFLAVAGFCFIVAGIYAYDPGAAVIALGVVLILIAWALIWTG